MPKRVLLPPLLASVTRLELLPGVPPAWVAGEVTVDGCSHSDYSAEGIRLERPFRELVARW